MKTALKLTFAAALLCGAPPLLGQPVVVETLQVDADKIHDVVSPNGIETTARANPSSDPFKVVIAAGGDSIFWARTQIILRDGFKATGGTSGSLPTGFIAAIDSDFDGYSDMEEITDTDGDGIFDAWEFVHGLNMLNAGDATQDFDGDGMNNFQEFLNNRDPNDAADSGTLPGGVQLVLKIPGPQYFGVNTSTWAISTVSAP